MFPLTIPGPDHTTDVLVLTGVTIALAVVVIQLREVELVEPIVMVVMFWACTKEPVLVHPLDVFVAV